MSNTLTNPERVDMLAATLATVLAEQDGIHPAHAANRVNLAVRIVSGIDTALSNSSGSLNPLTAEDVIRFATRLDGQRISDETRRLVILMWEALGGEIIN
jgi:hypothetical protein